MSSAPIARSQRPGGEECCRLRATAYERASVALTSLLLMIGLATLVLLLAWLSGAPRFERLPAEVAIWRSPPAPAPVPAAGASSVELSAPSEMELAEVASSPAELSLETIAPIVESQLVSFDALAIDGNDHDDIAAGRKSGGAWSGPGPGNGTWPWDRWEIRYSARDLEEYKRQLDFFGIEFGVAGGGSSVVYYLKDFSSDTPATRTGRPQDEQRIRFLYADGPLKEADRQIAQAAGIETAGRIVFQFHNSELYRTLLTLENERMKPRQISDVVRTVFGVRKTDSGYEFFVIRQDYRTPDVPPVR